MTERRRTGGGCSFDDRSSESSGGESERSESETESVDWSNCKSSVSLQHERRLRRTFLILEGSDEASVTELDTEIRERRNERVGDESDSVRSVGREIGVDDSDTRESIESLE